MCRNIQDQGCCFHLAAAHQRFPHIVAAPDPKQHPAHFKTSVILMHEAALFCVKSALCEAASCIQVIFFAMARGLTYVNILSTFSQARASAL